jgi:hypothetical protein
MPEPESHSEGIISKSEIAVFAELFDQFEFAEDPRSAKACEAKQKFDADARILFEERVKPNFLSCSEEAFEAGLRIWCRDWLHKNKPLDHRKKKKRTN